MAKDQRIHTAGDHAAALTASHGLIAAAACRLGVTRGSVYGMARRHPEVKEALEASREELLDVAEPKTYSEIARGNLRVCCWFLERAGRSKGYGTRIEVNPPTVTAAQLREMTDEQLEEHARELGLN